MRVDHPGRFAMLRRTVLELPQGRELQVACGAGALWLTLDNDLRDIVLQQDESFRVPADRRALVYAFRDSVLEMSAEPLRQERPKPQVAAPRRLELQGGAA